MCKEKKPYSRESLDEWNRGECHKEGKEEGRREWGAEVREEAEEDDDKNWMNKECRNVRVYTK